MDLRQNNATLGNSERALEQYVRALLFLIPPSETVVVMLVADIK